MDGKPRCSTPSRADHAICTLQPNSVLASHEDKAVARIQGPAQMRGHEYNAPLPGGKPALEGPAQVRAWKKDVCEGSRPVLPSGTTTSFGATRPTRAGAPTLNLLISSRTWRTAGQITLHKPVNLSGEEGLKEKKDFSCFGQGW